MNAAGPSIGVAIPFYRGLHHLDEALRSLLAQSDGDFVAVVIDDCSPEIGAGALVDAFGDARLRHVRNESNLGLSGNFNRCLTEPGTDVVAIFHADDLLEPTYVGTIRAAHADEPSAACVATWTTPIDGAGRERLTPVDRLKRWRWPRRQRHPLRGDAGLARLVHTFFVYTPAVSYRPALLPPDPFPARWRQVMDVDLFAQLLLSGGTILLDRTPAYRYRRHPGTETARNARAFTRLAEETEMSRIIADAAASRGWRRTSFAARLRWSIRLNGAVALAASLGRAAPGRGRAVRDVLDPR